MSQKVKVAGVQMIATDDIDHNLNRALETVELAAQNGAKIICLPELFAWPWFPLTIDKNRFEMAQTLTGPVINACRKKANSLGVYLLVPLFEDSEKGTYFNSVVVVNTEGDVTGIYRKMHVPQVPGWEEKSYFTPGNLGFPVFTAFGVPFGVQVSWDTFFPEGSRILALNGAKVIFTPTANAASNTDLWQQSICNNAFVNGCYVIRVNRVGQEGKVKFSGASFCAAPTGDLLEEPMGEVEGLGLWTVDMKAVDFVRREWPLFRDRRPSQYLKLAGVKTVREKANND